MYGLRGLVNVPGKPIKVIIRGASGISDGWGNVNYNVGEPYTVEASAPFAAADLRETILDSAGNVISSRILGQTDEAGSLIKQGVFTTPGSFTHTYFFGHTEDGVWYTNSSPIQYQITVGGGAAAPRTSSDAIYTGVYNDPNREYVPPPAYVERMKSWFPVDTTSDPPQTVTPSPAAGLKPSGIPLWGWALAAGAVLWMFKGER